MTDWPQEAHGIKVRRDKNGDPRLFTSVEDVRQPGVKRYRRMTQKEVENWIDSKTGETKVQPVDFDGIVP